MKTDQDAGQVAQFMRALAVSESGEPRLAEPRLIVRRARLLERLARHEAAERATRPVLMAGLVAPVLAVAIFSVVAVPGWPLGVVATVAVGLLALAAALPAALADP
jgi:hypothetical protein